jgi:hypothetical protein
MNPVEQQFECLKVQFGVATIQGLPSGAHLVTIPELALPAGWNSTSTTVKFLIPVGYPLAKPDCFWVDPTLRLATGATPQNTGPNPIPEVPGQCLWFSWHVGTWSPSRDTLLTYVRVIQNRFKEPR